MELELGLALPSSPSKGFDLNSHEMESKESLDYSCDLHGHCFSSCDGHDHLKNYNNNNTINKKRGFNEAFDDDQSFTATLRTLPLLHWDNLSNHVDDPEDISSAASNITIGEDGDSLVGWPPINSWRKQLCYENKLTVKNTCDCSHARSTHVKVHMEGVAIARKVDLSVCNSYKMLVQTLMDMFTKWQEDTDSYRLAYQDNEGDWLLAQDVPWSSFVQSVQRLKLMKSSS